MSKKNIRVELNYPQLEDFDGNRRSFLSKLGLGLASVAVGTSGCGTRSEATALGEEGTESGAGGAETGEQFLSLLVPGIGYVAESASVYFEWEDTSNPNAVYDLRVYSDAARTQKVHGTLGAVFDTQDLGTATSHTFANDPSDGAARYGLLWQWPDETYDDSSRTELLFEYTAYTKMVTSGEHSTPTFDVPAGEVEQYATVTWSDPDPDPNARLVLAIDGDEDGDSVPANESTSWAVQRSLSGGAHTFDLRRYLNNDLATFDVPTSMTVTVEAPVEVGTIFVSVDGDDANSGASEAEAFRTPQKGVDVALPGDIVNIKAGAYPAGQTISSVISGTESNPIHIRGYKDTPGDKPTIAFDIDSSDAGDPSAAPLLVAVDQNSDATTIGITIVHSYVEVSGIQSKFFTRGAQISGGASNSKLTRIYALANGDADYPEFYNGVSILCSGSSNTVSDSVAINGTGVGLDVQGNGNTYLRSMCIVNAFYETSSDNNKGTDYLFSVNGDGHFLHDCTLLQSDYMNSFHNGHGFNIRGSNVKIYNPVTVNMGEAIRFDSDSRGGATNCEVYDVDLQSTASEGHTNVAIVFEGSKCIGNLLSGGTVSRTGSAGHISVYYGYDDNPPQDLAGGQDNIVEGVTFNNGTDNLAHKRTGPPNSKNQTVRNCTFNGSAPLFQTEHVIESNCKVYDCTINLPTYSGGTASLNQMRVSLGSYSADGSATNSNDMAGAGFTLP